MKFQMNKDIIKQKRDESFVIFKKKKKKKKKKKFLKKKKKKKKKKKIQNIIIFQSPFQGELFSKYNIIIANGTIYVVP